MMRVLLGVALIALVGAVCFGVLGLIVWGLQC